MKWYHHGAKRIKCSPNFSSSFLPRYPSPIFTRIIYYATSDSGHMACPYIQNDSTVPESLSKLTEGVTKAICMKSSLGTP